MTPVQFELFWLAARIAGPPGFRTQAAGYDDKLATAHLPIGHTQYRMHYARIRTTQIPANIDLVFDCLYPPGRILRSASGTAERRDLEPCIRHVCMAGRTGESACWFHLSSRSGADTFEGHFTSADGKLVIRHDIGGYAGAWARRDKSFFFRENVIGDARVWIAKREWPDGKGKGGRTTLVAVTFPDSGCANFFLESSKPEHATPVDFIARSFRPTQRPWQAGGDASCRPLEHLKTNGKTPYPGETPDASMLPLDRAHQLRLRALLFEI